MLRSQTNLFSVRLGDKVAEFAHLHLHHVLVGRPEYGAGRHAEALQQACLQLDRMMLADEGMRGERAGATAVCALIKDGVLYCVSGATMVGRL